MDVTEEIHQEHLNGSKSMVFKMRPVVFIKQEVGLMGFNVLTLSHVVTVLKVKDVGQFLNMMYMKLKHGDEFQENLK